MSIRYAQEGRKTGTSKSHIFFFFQLKGPKNNNIYTAQFTLKLPLHATQPTQLTPPPFLLFAAIAASGCFVPARYCSLLSTISANGTKAE
jgi:hypothetical protein